MKNLFVAILAVTSAAAELSAQAIGTARVRHAPSINGNVDGSVQQMLPESVTLNGGANITGDLLLPGTPTVRLNGNPTYTGTIDGAGSASPTTHQVTLNGNVSLRRVVRRTDAVALTSVSAPPQPAGTRTVNINAANESPGSFTTLRNLTLNGNVGQFTIPAGTYGNFTANGGSGFTLGVAGAVTPSVYHFQNLNLNGQSQIQLLGPVVITVANGFSANGTVGTSANSAWLTLNVYSGGFTLNGGCNVYGTINAPNGTVIINGNSQLVGGLNADRLTVNGNGLLRLVTSGGNTAPVANSQSVSLNEDTPASVTLTGSASNGATLTYTVLSSPSHGSLSGTAPALTYTPTPDYNGADSFTFKVNDGQSDSSPATVTLTVVPANDRPVAIAKSATLAEDTSANVILAGTDVDGNALTFTVVTAPAHGSLSGTAPNLVYTPAPNYDGTDSFTYIASDGTLASTPAVFSLTVTPVNDAPTGTAANYTVNEGVTLPFTLTGADVDGDGLTFTVLTQPTKGTLTGTAPNLTYTPFPNTTALDSFTFRVSDGTLPSAPATITVQVNNLNDAPMAQSQTVTTAEDTALAVTLNGSDPDGDAITYVVVAQPQHGTLSGTAPALTYTPELNYYGPDSFTFRVRDTSLIDSNLATVSINITPVNDAPVAATAPVTTDEDTAAAITLAATDVDSTTLTFEVLTQPAHGTLTGTVPNLTYTPAANYFGPDSFTYRANDGSLDSAASTVSFTVRPVNDAPVATAQSRTTAEDTPISITQAGTDVEGSPLTFTIVTPPARGTLTGTAPDVIYTPAANYSGSDSFTFKVNDGGLDSAPATVSLTVTPVNDAPVATSQTFTQPQDTPISLTLAATDVDGDTLTYAVTTQPQNGTLSGAAPNFTYTPNFNFRGTDALTFTASDGQVTSNSATVTFVLSPVSHAPVANNQSVTLPEDSPLAVTLTASDLDGDTLTYEIIAQPTRGSLSGTAPNLTYTPTSNYNGTDSFTFKAKDAALSSALATVTLTITPVNDAPTASAQGVTLAEDTSASFTLAATDVDGDPLTYIFVTQPTRGTLSGTAPNLTYTPTANYNGSDSFTYKVRDGSLDSNVATVTFTITPVNDAPVAVAQTLVTDEDSPLAIQLTATDIDSTVLTYVIVTPPQHGALSGSAPNFTYTPTADYYGSDSFTFKANDGALDSAVATVSLTVRPVNDRPVASAQSISTGVATPVAVTLTGTDVEGSPLTFAVVASPQHGALSGTAPNLIYTPETGYAGQDSFTFKANDGALDSIPASISVSIDRNPQAPIITSQPPALTVVLPSTGTNQSAVNFTPIELRPVDVGSTLTNKFSALPTQNPALFGLNGTDVRRVNFDTYPDGSAVPNGAILSNQYQSVGVLMNNIPVSNNVFGGPASAPNTTFISDGMHIFTFNVPVVAVGIINTSPDKDRIEYYSPQGVRLFDTRDTAPDSATQYFVGARVNQGNLIGSVVITNVAGNDEFDELIFEVLTTQTFPGLFRYDVNASDPANLALSYSVAQGPSNMIMDSATGLLQWLPTGANAGPNQVTVRATNTLGLFDAQSFTINVVINAKPLVDAGPDRVVRSAGGSVQLLGSASDDGVPSTASFSMAWSVVSGPGTVTLSNSAIAQPTATFSAAGTYLLKLTAADGLEESSDLVEVRVGVATLPPPSGVAAWWPGNSHPNEIVRGNHDAALTNLGYLPGRVLQGFTFAGVSDSAVVTGHQDLDLSRDGQGITIEFWMQNPNIGGPDYPLFGWSNGGTAAVRASVVFNGLKPSWRLRDTAGNDYDGGTAGQIMTYGALTHLAFTYNQITGLSRIYHNGKLVLEQQLPVFTPRTDGDLWIGSRPGELNFRGVIDEFTLYKRALTPAEIAAIHQAGANGKMPPGINQGPAVNAGPDVSVAGISSTASLNGIVTDDNQPFGAPTIAWAKVEGPGSVTFANSAAAATTATFSAPGKYVLSLTATDNYTVPVTDVMEVRVGGGFLEAASGISAWWPANGDPREVVNGNHDIELLNGAGYATGRVSQGFRFLGTGDYGRTPAHADLNIGSSATGLTIEFWAQSTSSGTMLGWSGGANFYLVDGNRFGGNFREANGTSHDFDSYLWGADVMWSGSGWNHFAVTYDRVTGNAHFYQNGQRRHTQNWGAFALGTTGDFQLGNGAFAGLLDEVTLYKRPLSAAEIAAVYQAGANGKSPPDDNLPPVVSAGPDRAIASIASSATLAGTVTDDNKPFGAPTITWAKVDGPGTVTFANAAAASTTATFSAPGLYLLSLTATDNYTTPVSDVVEVRVGGGYPEPASGISAWWPGNGEPREIVNGNHDIELINGAGYAAGRVSQAFRFLGTGDYGRTAAHADLNIGSSATGLTIEFWAQSTSSGTMLGWAGGANFYLVDGNRFGGNFREANGTSHDFDSFLWGADVMWSGSGWNHFAVTYDRVTGAAQFYQNGQRRHTQNWGAFALGTTGEFQLGNGAFAGLLDEITLYKRPLTAAEIATIYQAGVNGKCPPDDNLPPVVSAGPDRILASTAGSASLAGVVTDDNKPFGAPVIAWTKVEGPGTVTFANAAAAATSATFSASGTYLLALTASDGLTNPATDVVEVRVGSGYVEAPAGISAWWPGNGDPREVINGNHDFELLNGAGYGPGKVAQAFRFSNTGDFAQAAAHADLNVGSSAAGLTIEFWMNSGSTGRILGWGSGANFYLVDGNRFGGNFREVGGTDHEFDSFAWGGGVMWIGAGTWHHVAISYDRVTGEARFYQNGELRRVQNWGSFALATTGDFFLGGSFTGSVDEVSLYRRPLTAAEITSIFNAGTFGKTVVPINQAPIANAGPDLSAFTGAAVALAGSATDDGLPNPPAALTYAWSRVSGPGTVTFGSPSAATTTATFSAAGTHTLRLTVSDSLLTGTDDVVVTATTPASAPPSVALYRPPVGAAVPATFAFNLSARATDTDGTIAKVEFFQGATKLGERTTPDAGDATSYTWTVSPGLAAGSYSFTAKATDNTGVSTTSAALTVSVVADPGPPVLAYGAPGEDARISQPTAVTGVVASTILAEWRVEQRLKVADGQTPFAWATVSTGTTSVGTPAAGANPAVPGALGNFDPTLLLNGIYELRLTASDTAGRQISLQPFPVVVEGNMKVGAFTLAFEDLKLPLAGIPITLTRTYDSRDSRLGDFGPGWRLALNNVRVQKNRPLGDDWWQTPQSGTGIQFYDVLPLVDRIVTVVMPDGETHRFKAGAYVKNRVGDPDYRSFAVVVTRGKYRFYPIGDTTAQLEPLNASNVLAEDFWIGGTGDQDLREEDPASNPFAANFNPTRFRLTTKDGSVFILDETLGLIELRDLSGNTLAVNRDAQQRVNGVTSTQNAPGGAITRSVTIVRDANGRVDYIRDPAGRDLDYTYDTSGRLAAFVNRELNVTQFRYENTAFPNYLTKIIDPRGINALRTEYDPVTGKLTKQIDADGKETIFTRGIDGTGRFEKVRDRLNNETTFYYDARGNVTLKIDPLGAQTSYSYWPDSDRVKLETDHYGNVKSMAYDAQGNVLVQTVGALASEDPANPTTGRITRTTYNARSAPTQITDPDGRVQTFAYDATTNNLLTHTLGVGSTAPSATTYTYKADGTPDTITDPLGNTTVHAYNYAFSDASYPGAVKQVTVTVTDPAGTAGSDPANATATVLRVTKMLYDTQENLLAQIVTRTLPVGGTEDVVTRHRYDTENRLVATIQPDGRVNETRYTSFGKEDKTALWKTLADFTAHVDANARLTSRTYDNRGNLVSTTHADGTTESMSFDLENRKEWSQDRRGYRTFFTYDTVGRLRFTIHPDSNDTAGTGLPPTVATDSRLTDNPRTETVYDLAGRVTDTYDELRRRTTTVYFANGTPDALRRQQTVQVRAAGNLTTTYAYDGAGNVRFVTDPRGNQTETRYDEHGRPRLVVLPATDEHPATQRETKYDRMGRRIELLDQEGRITRHRYDGLGRLVEVRLYLDQSLAASDTAFTLPATNPGLAVTRYAYDELGAQTAQTDARGRVTTYDNDSLGRRTKRTLPKEAAEATAPAETLQYDEWGNLWKRTDFAGKVTTFGYDALYRLKSKTADATHPSLIYSHAIARIEFDYDANGARTAARTYRNGNIQLYAETTPRDERGRIDYKDTAAGRLDYSHHANNLLKDTVSSNTGGLNVGYRYDEANRLEFVDDTSTGLPTRTTGYTYNANGSLATATAPNGVVHTYVYDTQNRLRTLNVTRGATTLRAYDYKLRASGHRNQTIEGARTVTYAYDGAYRLTGETITGDPAANNGALGYTLDQVGNRSARTSTLGAIGAQSGLTFNVRDWQSGETYTANGSTQSSAQLSALFPALAGTDTYDFEERLILRTRADGTTINLNYDADGNRIGKNILNASAQSVSSTGWLVDTNNPTGYAQVAEERVTTASGTTLRVFTYGHALLSQATSINAAAATLSYHGMDGFGTVRQLTDATGTATDAYDFDAFGNLIRRTGTTTNAHLYRGEEFDADLGLYYLRARYLNPDSGRFWSLDSYEGSASDPMSLHKYVFGNSNPVMFRDPSGHMTLAETQVTFATIGLIAVIAVPQVFQSGINAARILIQAGMYGAEQAAGNISANIAALALALDTMRANDKARARPVALELGNPKLAKAVIGETMNRVASAALFYSAETFAPISFLGGSLPSFPLQSQEEFNYWMWANRAWIRSVMSRQMLIIDIGRDATKAGMGIRQSEYYSMELAETAQYMRKVNVPWPPGVIDLTLN